MHTKKQNQLNVKSLGRLYSRERVARLNPQHTQAVFAAPKCLTPSFLIGYSLEAKGKPPQSELSLDQSGS